MLEADELMHREDPEDQLRGVLAGQREELRDTLEAHYLGALRQSFTRLEQDLVGQPHPEPAVPKKDFIPMQAAGGG